MSLKRFLWVSLAFQTLRQDLKWQWWPSYSDWIQVWEWRRNQRSPNPGALCLDGDSLLSVTHNWGMPLLSLPTIYNAACACCSRRGGLVLFYLSFIVLRTSSLFLSPHVVILSTVVRWLLPSSSPAYLMTILLSWVEAHVCHVCGERRVWDWSGSSMGLSRDLLSHPWWKKILSTGPFADRCWYSAVCQLGSHVYVLLVSRCWRT